MKDSNTCHSLTKTNDGVYAAAGFMRPLLLYMDMLIKKYKIEIGSVSIIIKDHILIFLSASSFFIVERSAAGRFSACMPTSSIMEFEAIVRNEIA